MMAAAVLCRRMPRLRCLPGLREPFIQAQHMHVKQLEEADDPEGKDMGQQHQEASLFEGYRLLYNPSQYHQWSPVPQSLVDNEEDEQCLSAIAPSFWQQSNRYSMSCSRHLSSSKNTLLDLAFHKSPEQETPPVTQLRRKATQPDVEVDTRAFHKCRPAYASLTLDLSQRPPPIEWEEAKLLLKKVAILKGSMKPSDVAHIFIQLGHLHPDSILSMRSNQHFIMLLRYSVEHLRFFTEGELLEVLQAFVRIGMPSVHTVLRVYESEFIRRSHKMDLHQLLLVADLWRCIGKQVPQFLSHLHDSVILNLEQIGAPELVQLVYILGEARQCPSNLVRPVEQLLMQNLQQLYPEEIGIVCLGLFKSQTSVSEHLVTSVVVKAHSFVKEMSDFAIVNVMKFLRFNYIYNRMWMEAMVQEIPLRAHRMGTQGLMHVALTCSAMRFYSDDILTAIAERVPSLIAHCRSKDSGKLLWAFGNLGFQPVQSPSFHPSLIEALRQRKAEFTRYPEHLLTALLGLAFASQFPKDLLELALSPDFVSVALKSLQLELKKDLFTLDGAVSLELPCWSGPRLSPELKEQVAEMLWDFAQSDVCLKPEVLEAESALQDLLGGEKYVVKRMILPHTRSIDLEIHLDSTGKPIPVNIESPSSAPSHEDSLSNFPLKGWGKKSIEVTLTDDLFTQLINTKKTSAPLPPPPMLNSPSPQRIEPNEGDRLFNTGLKLTSDLTEALIKPRSPGPTSKSIIKLAIQVPSRNHYCCHSQRMIGLYVMKRRQLKLAGYKVVELSYQDWFPMLRKSRAQKLAYLHCKVYDSLS